MSTNPDCTSHVRVGRPKRVRQPLTKLPPWNGDSDRGDMDFWSQDIASYYPGKRMKMPLTIVDGYDEDDDTPRLVGDSDYDEDGEYITAPVPAPTPVKPAEPPPHFDEDTKKDEVEVTKTTIWAPSSSTLTIYEREF